MRTSRRAPACCTSGRRSSSYNCAPAYGAMTAYRKTPTRTAPRDSCNCMASSRPLGDAPDRSYAPKLERFSRFIEPEFIRLFLALGLERGAEVLIVACGVA